jgi:hypothetical protein
MIAQGGDIFVPDVWEFTNCSSDSTSPGNTFLNVVLVFAGDDASPASDTSLEVDHHGKPFA